MRVCLHSANFGAIDNPPVHEVQVGVTLETHVFTDANFPSRKCAMLPRLKARIPKMFGWDLLPGYDAYLWMDGSYSLSRPDSVAWLLEHLGDGDITLYRHGSRTTIREEAEFIRAKIAAGSHYLRVRYDGEDLDGQMAAIAADPGYVDDRLYGSSVLLYRPTTRMKCALTDWWVHTSRFHSVDQLALPYVLWAQDCDVRVIDQDNQHATHTAWQRHRTNHV
jgi:hypothetical protein